MFSNKPSIIVYGTGGHAKVVADVILSENKYNLFGFLEDCEEKNNFLGKPVFHRLEDIPKNIKIAFIGIGDNKTRREKALFLRKNGFQLPFLVHPQAHISKLEIKISSGTVIMAGAIINPGTIIGEDSIINTGATIDHDNKIGNAVHIAPQACLCGGVSIDDFSWVGANSCIKQYQKIGKNCLIGMGAAVVNDIHDNLIVSGVPAKPNNN